MDQTEVPIKQPETRPITQEQLVAEVKGIYAGLVMVESKCIEVDNAQSSTIETGPKLNNEQWQALIALHRTLLHEHNDFFLSQSSSAPKKSHFSSGVTDYIVEGSVNGIGIEASPDTGSDECIVSSDFASKLGQSTVPGTEKTMTLANGKKVWSPGMIEVLWRFANDQTPHILKCWILPNSSKDFVLGSRFLKMTGALTTFFRHAKKAIIPSRPQLRLMGEKKERMMGFLNRRLTTALADTGSDLMAVSLKYAQLHKWAISTEREHRTEVELADGMRAWTCGTVSDATWTIGDRTVRCDFHVLDGLPADVILSKEYLFEMDVFTEHQDSFFDVEAIEDISLLCGIRLIEKEAFDLNELERDFPRTVTSTLPDAFNAQAVKRERRRRTLAEKMIEGLPDSERSEATKVEKGKRCRWDMARLGHNDLSKGQQPSLTSTAGQGGSSQSSRPALETIHQIQSSGQDSFELGPI
ncbi:hypothetical protein CGLO_15630 [Colletotrichum gloeosporioides Cg-14]|uniref:Uncharacterized protein n=1 Tax=Colletotrichum gloeosporioides (strain Cg-14) TaxID=1237896 RepID=T0K1A4_COLGC|nr:hypothetical protein CGLO_15630 [Colletotrichum gloeosporioides Cg-14]